MQFKKFFRSEAILALVLVFMGAVTALGKTESDKEKTSPSEGQEEKQKADPKDSSDEKAADEAAEGEKPEDTEMDDDDAEEKEAQGPAVARPVSPDPIQVYGWREKIHIDGMEKSITAKLDTGAYTSSIHAEEKELFERDGKKWLRFIVTEPRKKNSPRVRLEAPLVRIARIKNPGGESEIREVVRLTFKLGDRKLRGEFTLNNRSNMLSAVLIGRTTIKELGWIDPSRTNLADDKIMR